MSSIWMPCLVRSREPDVVPVQLGEVTIDAYLRFVWARARRNTLLAVAFDLKVFFGVVVKAPSEIRPADVLRFVEVQRRPVRGANRHLPVGRMGFMTLAGRPVPRPWGCCS